MTSKGAGLSLEVTGESSNLFEEIQNGFQPVLLGLESNYSLENRLGWTENRISYQMQGESECLGLIVWDSVEKNVLGQYGAAWLHSFPGYLERAPALLQK